MPAQVAIADIDPQPDMKVRFISDLHYGHERCEAPPPEKLDFLLEGTDMLVVAGDLAETRSCAWQERGIDLRQQLRRRCRDKGVQLVEIAGNHDPDAGPLLIRFWGGRVVAMHGHALYKEGAPWSWEYLHAREKCQQLIASYADCDTSLESRLRLSWDMCQLSPPIMRREGIRNPLLRGFLHCFWPPMRPLLIVWGWITCGRRTERFARQFFPEAETVILGHFHRSGHWKYGSRHIFNTGAWFRHALPYCVEMQDSRVISYKKLEKYD